MPDLLCGVCREREQLGIQVLFQRERRSKLRRRAVVEDEEVLARPVTRERAATAGD